MNHFIPDKHIHWDVQDNKDCPVCSAKKEEISSKLAEPKSVSSECPKAGQPHYGCGRCHPLPHLSEKIVHDQPQPEEWEKKFDRTFLYDDGRMSVPANERDDAKDIKDFIHTLLQKEYERGRKEEFEGIQRQFNGKGIQHPDIRKVRADTLNEVEKIIEGMTKHCPSGVYHYDCQECGYNEALDDLLHRIRNLKK